jgi:hypothetical protein
MADPRIRIHEEKVGNALKETDQELKNLKGSADETGAKLDKLTIGLSALAAAAGVVTALAALLIPLLLAQ